MQSIRRRRARGRGRGDGFGHARPSGQFTTSVSQTTSSPPPALLIPSNIKGNTAHCFAYPFASPSLPSRHVPAMTASPAARIITQLIERRSLIIIIIQAGVRVTDRHDAFVPWLGRNFQSCPGRIGVVWCGHSSGRPVALALRVPPPAFLVSFRKMAPRASEAAHELSQLPW